MASYSGIVPYGNDTAHNQDTPSNVNTMPTGEQDTYSDEAIEDDGMACLRQLKQECGTLVDSGDLSKEFVEQIKSLLASVKVDELNVAQQSDVMRVVEKVFGRSLEAQQLYPFTAMAILQSVPINLDIYYSSNRNEADLPSLPDGWLDNVRTLIIPVDAYLHSDWPMDSSSLPRVTACLASLKAKLPKVHRFRIRLNLHCKTYSKDLLDRERYAGYSGKTNYRTLIEKLVASIIKYQPGRKRDLAIRVLTGSEGGIICAKGQNLDEQASLDILGDVTKPK